MSLSSWQLWYSLFALAVSFLILCILSIGSYFHTMVESLVGWGYTRGEDIRGAPYDWRRAPSKWSPLFPT